MKINFYFIYFVLVSNLFICSMVKGRVIKINSSNPNKLKEFEDYLSEKGHTLESENIDLLEPNADHLTVIQFKASQFLDEVLVDDVALNIEDHPEVGINIRKYIETGEIRDEKYLGKRATFTCYQGIKRGQYVYIYTAKVEGQIVKPRGDGFGIGPYFLPFGTDKTLGEYMNPQYNARYLALQKLLKNQWDHKRSLLIKWAGDFQ